MCTQTDMTQACRDTQSKGTQELKFCAYFPVWQPLSQKSFFTSHNLPYALKCEKKKKWRGEQQPKNFHETPGEHLLPLTGID